MSLEQRLSDAAISVLRDQMRPGRRVQIQLPSFVLPRLPPPPVNLPVDSQWPASFQTSIDSAVSKAWSAGTIKTYTSFINIFIKFCQNHGLPATQIFPALDYLLCAFLASLNQTVSKSTIKNYLTGLRAWHVGNGFNFCRSDRLNLLANASRPQAHKAPLRPPVTVAMLELLARKLDLTNSFDSCVFACACTAFWGLARLGELLPAVYAFNHNQPPFPLVSHVSPGRLGSTKISLPWTKVKKWDGEILILSVQEGPTNPVRAIKNHLQVNNLSPNSILFSFVDLHGPTVLLKRQFLTRCQQIWNSSNLNGPHPTGHSFRIGGTSHLLLCGIHPDVIKKTGRWLSDSFLRYWRNLDTVIPAHTSNSVRQSGHLGEPRRRLGCGLLPSGVASTAGGSSSAARSETVREVPT